MKLTAVVGYYVLILLAAVDGEITSISTLIKTKLFVDKSLLIRDDLINCPNEPKIKILTAPPTFGKTVIIDMLYRFYSIQTDYSGKQISPYSTDSYGLFCAQKLKICDNEIYVNKHLGQHPVLRFDFWPLGSGQILKTFLEHVSYVLHIAFHDHQYLLRNSSLWTDELNKLYFIRITSIHNYEHLRSKLEVTKALRFLVELLFRHFGKRMIVLIDNYDALFRSMITKKIEDERYVIDVLGKLNEILLVDNKYLELAWLSGVMAVQGAGLSPISAQVQYYRWLGDHRFSKYFGFTKDELIEFIRTRANQFFNNEREYQEIQETIDLYYCGYNIVYQNTQLYNIWSVQEFFHYKMVPGLYWTYRNWQNLFRNHTQELVVKGDKIFINPNHIFVQEEITGLSLMRENRQVNKDGLHRLLFDLGYLTPTLIHNNTAMQLEIPNYEIHKRLCYEVRKFLLIKHLKPFYGNSAWLSFSVISLLQPKRSNSELYKPLFEIIRYIIANAQHQPIFKLDIQTFLFLVLGAKFPIRRLVGTNISKTNQEIVLKNIPECLEETLKNISKLKQQQDINISEELFDIAVINRYKLAIIVSTKTVKNKSDISQDSTIRMRILEDMAKEGLCKSLLVYENVLEQPPTEIFQLKVNLTGRIYVSIAYDETRKDTRMLIYDPLHDKNPTSIKSSSYAWASDQLDYQNIDTEIIQA